MKCVRAVFHSGLSRAALIAAAGALLANCAAQPVSQVRYGSGPKEYFPSGAKYGQASPRVVADGQAVPKGGGSYHVGRTYRIAGRSFSPRENANYTATGVASYYGAAFHGRKTANGEVFDRHAISAAHPTMPLPSYARVTNLSNGRSLIVRVNDRGPFHGGRIIDLSERVAHVLGTHASGTSRVKVDYVGRASTAGSDDRRLLASLREGGPAPAPDGVTAQPVQIASATPVTPSPQQFIRQSNERPPVIALTTVARPLAGPVSQPQLQIASADEAGDADHATPRPAPRSLPFPPDRPMDLGAPRRQLLVTGFAPLPETAPSRPARAGVIRPAPAQTAALYYAQPQGTLSRFGAAGDPLARIKTQHIVPLRAAEVKPASLELLAGVFRDRANAAKLAAVIGPLTRMASIEGQGGLLYKVTAGPFASEADAEAARSRAVNAGAAGARLLAR